MSLEKNLQEIETLFSAQKSFLMKAKATMFLFGTMGVLYVHIKLAGYRKPLPDWQIYLGDFSVAALIYLLIAVIPLYKFLADRALLKMTWAIKTSIINNALRPYTNDYHISFKGLLPNDDIEDLRLQKGFLQFCYGDDLIFGTLNSKRFRLSEIHSVSPFKRNFNGIIGVILLNKKADIELENKISKITAAENFPTSFSIATIKNKIVLTSKGRKKHFEFNIKKSRINKDDLEKDYSEFHTFIKTMNELSRL